MYISVFVGEGSALGGQKLIDIGYLPQSVSTLSLPELGVHQFDKAD